MIVITDLNAMDQISIRTQHSEYEFQVTEPAQCRGVLSGGLFGEEQHEAILTGAIAADRSQGRFSTELEIGTCAFFYVAAAESLKSLTTSVITNLKIRCDVH
ncbi:MAG TPA: hypothetical protein VF075_04555 [Pyrinomonadaceae bacterium]